MAELDERLRILVVDDSAVSRKLAEIALSGKPYMVEFAKDGREALDLFAIHQPDIVITDWTMPGMTGPELCTMIRNGLNSSDTYLILLTSNSGDAHKAEGLAAGADAHLTKPLRPSQLLGVIHTARGVIRMRRRMREEQVAGEKKT